jgi:hypothetical protein
MATVTLYLRDEDVARIAEAASREGTTIRRWCRIAIEREVARIGETVTAGPVRKPGHPRCRQRDNLEVIE